MTNEFYKFPDTTAALARASAKKRWKSFSTSSHNGVITRIGRLGFWVVAKVIH